MSAPVAGGTRLDAALAAARAMLAAAGVEEAALDARLLTQAATGLGHADLIARPETATATVAAATPVTITRTLTVWAKRTDGVAAADIKSLVETALVREAPSYPIGGIPKPPSTQGYVYADFISGVAKAAHSTIFDVDGAGADVALAAGEVAVFAISANVRLVEVP